MTQLFKVLLDGVDITQKVSECLVSKEINRFYHVITFKYGSEDGLILNSDVTVYYGDNILNCFIYSSSKISRNSHSVICRTIGAKLTEPFSTNDIALESATTSHELSALYASEIGVTINHTSGNLDFGGSYERKGTKLSALTNIANITGAEYYEKDGQIFIEPSVGIDSDGTIIYDDEIMDFVPVGRSIYNKGVGVITIRNGGTLTNDVISMNCINAEIDECDGSINIYPNPFGQLEHVQGIGTLKESIVTISQDLQVVDQDVVVLKGAIASIASVKLNGVSISNYNFEVGHNVIYFTTVQRGTLTVEYNAKAYKGYCDIEATPLGRFVAIDLYYLDQLLKFQAFLSEDCNVLGDSDDSMTVIVPSVMNYVQGFSVWIIGGLPTFHFFNRSEEITRGVATEVGDYIHRQDIRLEAYDQGGYISDTRYPIKAVTQVTSSGEPIPYTVILVDGIKRIKFEGYYPACEAVYTVEAQRYNIQFELIPNSEGDIRMVIINELTSRAFEYELTETTPCILNQTYNVDIAGQLGVELFEVVGETINYRHPITNAVTDVIVGDDGRVGIWVDADGEYVIDTSSLKIRTSIILTVNTGG